MKKRIMLSALVLPMMAIWADDERSKIDYAPSAPPKTEQVSVPLPINPDGINVVSGNLGDYKESFRNAFGNHMCLWLMAHKDTEKSYISWELDVPEAGVYEICAVAAGKGSKLALTCNGVTQDHFTEIKKHAVWERIPMGEFKLQKGVNRLQLTAVQGKKLEFDALEVVRPSVAKQITAEADKMRVQPDWFKDAGYGLMFQWTNRATPRSGDVKEWEQKVNDFDLDGFIKNVEDSGAAYVLWSITWGQQYISAPLKSLDELIAGRTTQRDLLGEMADALHKRGVKLIFYYHYGYDCNHSIDKEWMEASGGYKADKTEFYENFKKVVSEIGDRYGEKLNGWWFDGGQRFYNCHFDNSQGDQGPLSAPFKELTLASRSGNSQRVVAYNAWIKPKLTEYQAYYGGEGSSSFPRLDEGVYPSGGREGLQAHGCFILEKEWGHIKKDTPIPAPRYDLERLSAMIKRAQQGRYPLSINLEMYEDGSVSPESMELLKQLKQAVR